MLADGVNPFTIAKSAQEWVEATVRTGESLDHSYASSPLAPLVARVQQFALICGMINVGVCNSFPLRMYRKARGKGSTRKRIGGKRLTYLKSYQHGPGRKAAEYAEYAGDVEEITEHKALDLLRNPNPYQSACDFDETAWMHLEFSGNCFQYVDPAGPGELYLCQPQNTRINTSRKNFIRSFIYHREATDPLVMAPGPKNREPWCMHFKAGPSLFSPYYGGSWLDAVILELDMNKSATVAEWHRWERGGRPDYHIEAPKQNMNREERDEYKTEFRRETQGVTKTGAFLLTSKDWKINPLGFRPKDMEYGGGIEYVERRVRQAAKVSEALLNVNSANVASADAGMVQYARQAVLPRLGRRAEYTTRYMTMLFDLKPGEVWFCYDNPVPEDELAETDRCIKLVSCGSMTYNEHRATQGLDPYPAEIGDVPRFNGVPLATIAQAHPEPVEPEAEKPEAPEAKDKQTGAAVQGDVQATALNGAQVTALKDLALSVANGELPEETARGMAAAAFPLLTPEQIDAIFSPLIGFEQRKPDPVETTNPTGDEDAAGDNADDQGDGDSRTYGAEDGGSSVRSPGSAKANAGRPGHPGTQGDARRTGDGNHQGVHHQAAATEGNAVGDGSEDHPVEEHDSDRAGGGGDRSDRAGASDGGSAGGGAHPIAAARSLRRKALAWYGRFNWSVKKLPELQLTPAAEAEMNDLAAALKRWFEKALEVGAVQTAQGYEPNFSAMQAELEKIVDEGLAKLSKLGWNLAAEDIGASFELKPESALKFLEGYKVRLAESISRNLAENLTDAVRAGLETGQTRVEVAEAIRGVTGDEAAWRADRIARTETSNAIESGRRQAYGEAGWTKGWDLSPNPCPMCEDIAAQNPGDDYPADYVFKGLEGEWFGGRGAPAHPGCVCGTRWSPPKENG